MLKNFTPRKGTNQTRRVGHIKNDTEQDIIQNSEGESEQAEEVDAEAALYIKELTEDG